MEFPHSWRRLVALGMRSLLAAMVLVLWMDATQAAQAANIEVDSVADNTMSDSACTLREAILHAQGSGNGDCAPGDSGADTITFAPSLGTSPKITLDGEQLPLISSEITISGTVTVDAAGLSRHFWITSTGVLTLDGLRLVNGKVGIDEAGGAIHNNGGRLTLIHAHILSNTARYGGGVYNTGAASRVVLSGTHILSNTADLSGGGFFNEGGQVVGLTDTQIYSNTAISGDGGGLVNVGQVTLTETQIYSNTAAGSGGGIYNGNGGQLSITGGKVRANTADFGGGFFNVDAGSQVTLTNTQILSNTAVSGGGFYNYSGGQVSMRGGKVRANTADFGGGFFSMGDGSRVTLSGTHILSNTASQGGGFDNQLSGRVSLSGGEIRGNTATFNHGGGFSNQLDGEVTLTNTLIVSNLAAGKGGGFANIMGEVSMNGGEISTNAANDIFFPPPPIFSDGGGFYNAGGRVTLTDTLILSNTAAGNAGGGGFYNSGGQVSLSGGEIRANTATNKGGGFYNEGANSRVTLTATRILSNTASNGGGVYNEDSGQVTVNESCIVANSHVAVVHDGASSTDASHNWWGAHTGPSGAYLGHGDGVTSNVVVTPFKTTPVLDCLTLPVPATVTKTGQPVGTLLPGQPVSYTLTMSNPGPQHVYNAVLSDLLPAELSVSEVVTGQEMVATGAMSWRVPHLGPGQAVTVDVRGQVTTTLSSDRTITNTAVLTSPLLAVSKTSEATNPVSLPRLSWAASSASGLESSGSVSLSVQLQPANPYAAVTVEYATQDDSAIAGSDYLTASGVLTFAPELDEQVVAVMLLDDDQLEATEHFTLTLSNPQGASLDDVQVRVEIVDDDSELSVAPAQLSHLEGDDGSTLYSYVLTRTGYLTRTAVVSYTVSGGVGVDGADFVGGALPSGTLSWPSGVVTRELEIAVAGDTLLEADEVFTVTLSDAPGVVVLNPTVTGQILNDDSGLSVGPGTLAHLEGNNDDSTPFRYVLTRTGYLTSEAVVSYTVSLGAGVDGNDLVVGQPLSGTVAWAVGEITQTLVITVAGDTLVEADEVFTVTLSNPQGALLLNESATGVIVNDDSGLSVGPSTVAHLEGDSGSTLYRYVLTRTGYLTSETVVSYTVSGGAGVSGDDFAGGTLPSGTLVWPVGAITQALEIAVAGDPLVEADEVFTVTLSDAHGVALLNATGVMVNDDQASLLVAVENPVQAAAVEQVSAVTFTVSLSGSVDVPITVEYATQDGTATAGEDYTAVNGTLTFSGQSGEAYPVVVAVNPERSGQPAEQFSLVLRNVQAQGRVVTLSNDGAASVTLPGLPTGLEPGQQPQTRRLFLPYLQP